MSIGNRDLVRLLCGGNVVGETDAYKDVEESSTLGWVIINGAVRARFGLSDPPRPEAKAVLSWLQDPQRGRVRCVMLTGDAKGPAEHISALVQLPLFDVRAELKPEDKLTSITHFKEELYTQSVSSSFPLTWCSKKKTVCMIGDGVNDAPALALADVSIAMAQHGAAMAMETADIAFMESDLRRLPFVVSLARRTVTVIRGNVTLSAVSKLVLIVLVVIGEATLWIAIISDIGAMLIVTAVSLTLMTFEGPKLILSTEESDSHANSSAPFLSPIAEQHEAL